MTAYVPPHLRHGHIGKPMHPPVLSRGELKTSKRTDSFLERSSNVAVFSIISRFVFGKTVDSLASSIPVDVSVPDTGSGDTYISSYVLPGWKNALAAITGGKVLGVTYNARDKRHTYGDSQICVTGKAKKGEDVFAAVSRELAEEIGIVPESDSSITHVVSGSIHSAKYETGIAHTYIVPAKSCRRYDPTSDAGLFSSSAEDNFSVRIQCFIFGTLEEIVALVKTITNLHGRNGDGLYGIAILDVEDLKKLVEM